MTVRTHIGVKSVIAINFGVNGNSSRGLFALRIFFSRGGIFPLFLEFRFFDAPRQGVASLLGGLRLSGLGSGADLGGGGPFGGEFGGALARHGPHTFEAFEVLEKTHFLEMAEPLAGLRPALEVRIFQTPS